MHVNTTRLAEEVASYVMLHACREQVDAEKPCIVNGLRPIQSPKLAEPA